MTQEAMTSSPAERARVVADFGAKWSGCARTLLGSRKGSLRDLARTSLCMFRMLVDRDMRLSPATVAMLVATLAYFISPFDLVPDSLLVVGYLDDAMLVAEVALLLSSDIARYRALRASREEADDDDAPAPEELAPNGARFAPEPHAAEA
jgi:uncharacterized membrane protein YkvA (DUF1232 family)